MVTRRIVLAGSLGMAASSALPEHLFAREIGSYRLVAGKAQAGFLEDATVKTDVWAYGGQVPGPVIRARKGEEIAVEFVNQLDQPTSIHWHGIRIENAMDGVSYLTQTPVEPGETFKYRFTVPDAGTYWYHPHNRTWEQLARGLYGMLIVEGDESETGIRDLLIAADDWRLEENGTLDEASLGSMHDWSHAGRLGNILTLNGKPYERFDVSPDERVRLRLVNAANARILRFALGDHDNWLVALDGQPVPPTLLGKEGVTLAPAQRADVVVNLNAREGDEVPIIETSGQEGLIAGYLVCSRPKLNIASVDKKPLALISNALPEPHDENAQELELVMTGGAMRFLTSATFKGQVLSGRELATRHRQVWAFNGIAGMAKEPLFKANNGETIRMKLINETVWPHSIHVHGHHFKLLSRSNRNDGAQQLLSDYEAASWRDTVLLARDEVVEIAFVADNPGKWMLHCHMLEHQAAGMGTWFEVG